MTYLEKIIMQEIATLSETRHADVLAFIRYLKMSSTDQQKMPEEWKEIQGWFEHVLKSIRTHQDQYDGDVKS